MRSTVSSITTFNENELSRHDRDLLIAQTSLDTRRLGREVRYQQDIITGLTTIVTMGFLFTSMMSFIGRWTLNRRLAKIEKMLKEAENPALKMLSYRRIHSRDFKWSDGNTT
jgi:hypothetical protein